MLPTFELWQGKKISRGFCKKPNPYRLAFFLKLKIENMKKDLERALIQREIGKKISLKDDLNHFWKLFIELEVSEKTFKEVQAKHSSKIAQINISIRDLEKEKNRIF
ncbi:MAG TPA: hypothetical protein VFM70_04345 [Salinimicrobium sp.]|nr:hypothetical protein [Salinimicrobium sp.]